MQLNPFPWYPGLQVQFILPPTSLHVAFFWHVLLLMHRFTSVIIMNKFHCLSNKETATETQDNNKQTTNIIIIIKIGQRARLVWNVHKLQSRPL